MMALTADGQIAKNTNHPANWTSLADKKMFIRETKRVGVIIMGKTTYDTIGRPLPGRLNIVMDLKADSQKDKPDLLEFTQKQPKQLLKELAERGYQEVILGGGATINGLFLKQNLIDEIWLTIEPRLFGEGLPLFKNVSVDLTLTDLRVKRLDQNVLQLRYKVKR